MTTQIRSFNRSPFIDVTFVILGILLGLIIALMGGLLWLNYQNDPANNILVATSSHIVGNIPTWWQTVFYKEAHIMGLPLTGETKAYWYIARSSGIFAYLLLWFATAWGITMSSKMTSTLITTPVTYGLHEFFPILATIFATLHAVILLGDSYIQFNIIHLIIPFISPYKPLWTGLGVIALQLCVALIVSFYIRKRTGHKIWRGFHYLSYLAFVLVLIHGLMAGSDSQFILIKGMYLLTGLSILFLTYYRLFTLRFKQKRTA